MQHQCSTGGGTLTEQTAAAQPEFSVGIFLPNATFDGDGKCIAMTGGYIMDRRQGNTDGLGGVYGLCAALGLPTPSPAWLLRTPTQNWARLTGSS